MKKDQHDEHDVKHRGQVNLTAFFCRSDLA
jgi:hypothetical protein